jgi:hypothetical protein
MFATCLGCYSHEIYPTVSRRVMIFFMSFHGWWDCRFFSLNPLFNWFRDCLREFSGLTLSRLGVKTSN